MLCYPGESKFQAVIMIVKIRILKIRIIIWPCLSGSENRRIGELYVALKYVKVFSVMWLLSCSCPAPVSLV